MFKRWKRNNADEEYTNALREELKAVGKWKEVAHAPSTVFLLEVIKETIKNAEDQWAAALVSKPDTDIIVFRSAVLSKVNTLKALVREITESPERCLNIEKELLK